MAIGKIECPSLAHILNPGKSPGKYPKSSMCQQATPCLRGLRGFSALKTSQPEFWRRKKPKQARLSQRQKRKARVACEPGQTVTRQNCSPCGARMQPP